MVLELRKLHLHYWKGKGTDNRLQQSPHTRLPATFSASFHSFREIFKSCHCHCVLDTPADIFQHHPWTACTKYAVAHAKTWSISFALVQGFSSFLGQRAPSSQMWSSVPWQPDTKWGGVACDIPPPPGSGRVGSACIGWCVAALHSHLPQLQVPH